MHTIETKRHHNKRINSKTEKIAKYMFGYNEIGFHRKGENEFSFLTEQELLKKREEWVKNNRQNRKACSCYMCCNPRYNKYSKGKNKLTLQEQKLIQKSKFIETED